MKTHAPLADLAEEYLSYRRKLGYKLKVEGSQLMNFARFADSSGHRGPLTTELALTWARLPTGTSRLYQARRLEVVRCFAKHLAIFDPQTQIPGNRLLGPAHQRTHPHIYTPTEIARLMARALTLRPKNGLRPQTYATLIGLMASTGLRTIEAVTLSREDVDLRCGVVTVRETKYFKSRLVPLLASTVGALREYVRFRDRYLPLPLSRTFLLGERGGSLKSSTLHWTFRRIREACHIEHNGRAPRLYDLRHTFCTRRLLEWHRRGVDVEQAIPALSTYVGHVKVTNTYWYLSGIPELFALVGDRFEQYASHGERS